MTDPVLQSVLRNALLPRQSQRLSLLACSRYAEVERLGRTATRSRLSRMA